MKRFFAAVLLVTALFVIPGQTGYGVARAQGACTLPLAQAPAVDGLRLGMKADEVLALFPGSRADKEVRASLLAPPGRVGVSGLTIMPARYSSKEKFPRVTAITLTFLDGRVSTLNVHYAGPEYKHVDEFLGKFLEGRKLPAAHAWEPYVGMDTQLKTLNCKGFELKVYAGGKNVQNINYIELTDVAARRRLKDRRDKAGAAKPGQ